MAVKSNRKEMNETFLFVLKTIKGNRDCFIKAWERIHKRHTDAVADLRRNFQPNSPKLSQEISIQDHIRETDLASAKKAAEIGVFAQLEKLAQDEYYAVSCRPNVEVLSELTALCRIPLTKREFEAIKDRYTGLGGYWCEKMLREIANSNGITANDLRPSYDDRMQLISEISENFRHFIDGYGGHPKHPDSDYFKMVTAVSDAVCDRAGSLYCTGCEDFLAADSDVVSRTLSRVANAGSTFESAQLLKNAVTNMNENAKTELLCVLSLENNRFSENILRLSGLSDHVKMYRKNGTAKAYIKAKEKFKDLESIEDAGSLSQRLNELSDNQYIQNMAVSKARTSDLFKAALELRSTDTLSTKQER